MSIWKYAAWLPELDPVHRVTLGEGETPLVASRRLGAELGVPRLAFKLETTNPTGSYKDRFAAAALSHLRAAGRLCCLGTSSGNTGAAVAAYAAAAGLPCLLAIVDTAPEGKLRQMLAYGARLFRIRNFGLDPAVTQEVMQGFPALAQRLRAEVLISAYAYSPLGMAGVETISHELAAQLPDGIDHVFSPSGGGGLTLAVARGFARSASFRPAVHCVQPEGNDTIAGPLRAGAARARAVTCTSRISGLQVGSVIDGDATLAACRAAGGNGHLVTDEEVFGWQRRLAREEGIFCEPAGAVALAGLARAAAAGEVRSGQQVVCLVTGSGFKDGDSLARMVEGDACPRLDDFATFAREVTARLAAG